MLGVQDIESKLDIMFDEHSNDFKAKNFVFNAISLLRRRFCYARSGHIASFPLDMPITMVAMFGLKITLNKLHLSRYPKFVVRA